MKTSLIAIIGVLFVTGGVIADVKFSATTERTAVTTGEQVIIVATLVNSKSSGSVPIPKVPPSEAFTLLRTDQRQSSSSSIQIINGKASQKTEIITQYYYVISPKTTGSFQFPALEIHVGGATYKTDPISFKVSAEPVNNPDIRVSLHLNKRTLFVGEQTILTFKVAQRAQSSTEVRNGFMPSLEQLEKAFGKDFSLNRLFTNQVTTSQERIDGEMYNVYALRFSLFPLAAGQYPIGPVPFEFQELRRAQRRRMDPFFDDFFDMNFFGGGVQSIPKNAFSNKMTIQVNPLPPAPAGYTGAVGKVSVSAQVDKLEIPAGEAVTLKVTVKGTTRPGNIGDVIIPPLEDCEIFKPERQVFSDTSAAGISTRKIAKYLLILRREGTVTIPPVTLPYFDPESGTFKTAASNPITLTVTPGKGGPKTQNRYLTQEEIREVGQDIRYIKTGIKMKNEAERPYREPIFFLLLPLPLMLVVVSLLYRLQSVNRERNSAKCVRKKALGAALKKLSALRKKNSSLSPSDFLGAVADTIEQFISQKFSFAATGRTLDELKTELLTRNANAATVNELTSFIEHLDSFRFGGATLDQKSRVTILEKAELFLNGLQKGTKKEKTGMIGTSAILLIAFGIFGSVSAAPVQHWSERAEKFYIEQNYDSAVVYYEKIIDAGVKNSAIYYNIGNSWFRLRKLGLARLYYEKAARLDPKDADIAANIRFVNSNILDRVPEPERGFLESILWQLHIMLPLKTQVWLSFGILLFLSLLVSACIYLSGNIRLWLIYLIVILSLSLSSIGISIGLKIYDLEKVTYAILLTQSTDARNEPDGSKVLFTTHEGTKFRIRKTDGNWSLVSLPNGVSGWVESKHLGKI